MLSCFSGLVGIYQIRILVRMADAFGWNWLKLDGLAGGALIHAPIHPSGQRFQFRLRGRLGRAGVNHRGYAFAPANRDGIGLDAEAWGIEVR